MWWEDPGFVMMVFMIGKAEESVSKQFKETWLIKF